MIIVVACVLYLALFYYFHYIFDIICTGFSLSTSSFIRVSWRAFVLTIWGTHLKINRLKSLSRLIPVIEAWKKV